MADDGATDPRFSTRSQFGSVKQEAISPYKIPPNVHTSPKVVGGTRSQFGSQAESDKRTAPAVGFGTGPRFKLDNQFISKDHSKGATPKWVPGPGTYKARSSIGNQPESFRSNPRETGFSKDDRFGPDSRELKRVGVTPSPGAYETAISSVGPQAQSKTGNAMPIRFGTSTREKNICQKGFETPFFGVDSPGPKYPAGHGAIGHQPYGHRRNAASVGFTRELRSMDPQKPNRRDRLTASIPGPDQYQVRERIGREKPAIGFTRDTRERAHYVSLSKEGAEALLKGTLSPGPNYAGRDSVGVQNEAHKRNSAVTRFTTASRFPKESAEVTPGPGAYVT